MGVGLSSQWGSGHLPLQQNPIKASLQRRPLQFSAAQNPPLAKKPPASLWHSAILSSVMLLGLGLLNAFPKPLMAQTPPEKPNILTDKAAKKEEKNPKADVNQQEPISTLSPEAFQKYQEVVHNVLALRKIDVNKKELKLNDLAKFFLPGARGIESLFPHQQFFLNKIAPKGSLKIPQLIELLASMDVNQDTFLTDEEIINHSWGPVAKEYLIQEAKTADLSKKESVKKIEQWFKTNQFSLSGPVGFNWYKQNTEDGTGNLNAIHAAERYDWMLMKIQRAGASFMVASAKPDFVKETKRIFFQRILDTQGTIPYFEQYNPSQGTLLFTENTVKQVEDIGTIHCTVEAEKKVLFSLIMGGVTQTVQKGSDTEHLFFKPENSVGKPETLIQEYGKRLEAFVQNEDNPKILNNLYQNLPEVLNDRVQLEKTLNQLTGALTKSFGLPMCQTGVPTRLPAAKEGKIFGVYCKDENMIILDQQSFLALAKMMEERGVSPKAQKDLLAKKLLGVIIHENVHHLTQRLVQTATYHPENFTNHPDLLKRVHDYQMNADFYIKTEDAPILGIEDSPKQPWEKDADYVADHVLKLIEKKWFPATAPISPNR